MPKGLGGAMIIAGTSVGAGMFSLPVIAAGMGVGYGLLLLVFAWYCMYSSGLMLLETHLHFANNSSFDTHTHRTLGPSARLVNGLSVAFVLYILTYAYVSGGGSTLFHTLQYIRLPLPQWLCSLLFGLVLALVVLISTQAVERITSLMLVIMALCFVVAMAILIGAVSLPHVIPTGSLSYWPYTFMALPFMLTSFGYHGNVPSLVKYYHGDAQAVRNSLLYGSGIALSCYGLWLIASLGVLGRDSWPALIAAGGNMGVVISALEQAVNRDHLPVVLKAFAGLAVASSFLGVTLGLFDYIADACQFTDDKVGRLKTGSVTFVPPVLLALLFPDGFIKAIGFAAVAATVFAVITPVLLVSTARRRWGIVRYTVPGGTQKLALVLLFGILVILFHGLTWMGMLPQFQ